MIRRPAGRATMAAPVFKCPCGACVEARVIVRQIFDVLNIYGWLLDSYVVVRNTRVLLLIKIARYSYFVLWFLTLVRLHRIFQVQSNVITSGHISLRVLSY
jgi:hypothetical protein